MEINSYFSILNKQVAKAYKIANTARSQGKDPELKVDIPVAKNKAERCVSLVGAVAPEILGKGIPERIMKLEEEYEAGDFRVALTIAYEVASGKFCNFNSKEKALETGLRLGLAYITLGTVSAPLEGFVELKIKKTSDGKDYLAIYYAGPIRAAGGTAAAVSVLIADYLRYKFGYAKYDIRQEEVERYIYECSDYHSRVSRLQYYPSNEELSFLVKHIGVEVSGDPTTTFDVSNRKDLERVETNQIRGGMCLVLCEGVAQKAGKIYKKLKSWGDSFDFKEWSWIKEFLDIQKRIWTKKDKKEETTDAKLTPNFKFIQDAVAGRPIFSYPLRRGGFRLRYGRTRFMGHECMGFNPATMKICNDFLAIGTQLKIELPGKGCTVTPCEVIDGPIVELADGTVLKINTSEKAEEVKNKIKRIIYLGDILINFGAFKEHGHKLVPSPYVPEWWVLDLKSAVQEKGYKSFNKKRIDELINNPFTCTPDLEEALKLSKEYGIPLHPDHLFFYNQDKSDLLAVAKNLSLQMPISLKRQLSLLGVPHKVSGDKLIIDELDYKRLKLALSKYEGKSDDIFSELSKCAGIKIMDKAPVFIGARMGRPEKAKLRTLKGTPHVMFPVGKEGGRLRSFNAAYEVGFVEGDFPLMLCPKCNRKTILSVCEVCGSKTNHYYICKKCKREVMTPTHCNTKCTSFSKQRIDIKHYINCALRNLSMQMPPLVKGVRGTSNKTHFPEPLEKGILRAKHGVYVNKDATIRLDFTELAITHFKPKEIGTSISKLKELGYTKDIYGNELTSEDQILELMPQDVIVGECKEFPGADMSRHLINIANFVDELLVKFYHLEPYYNVTSKNDLIGKLVICLAPHTSAGIVGRIIGFSKVQALIAHPYLHAGCRRDCFAYDTYIPFFDGKYWHISKLGDYIKSFKNVKKSIVDDFGTIGFKVNGIQTLPFKHAANNVKEFTIHTIRDHLIKVTTSTGRTLTVTPYHKFKTDKGIKKALELKEGDCLPIPKKIEIPVKDIKFLFLPEELLNSPLKNEIMIRNIKPFIRPLITNKKQIANYLFRDSFPLLLVKKILENNNMSLKDLPEHAKIGLKRRKISIPIKLNINNEFLRLLGYYLSEGHCRKGNRCFQVCFATYEDEMKKDVKQICSKLFNIKPYFNKNNSSLTCSSRLIYCIFNNMLCCGSNAYKKRIPSFILSLPESKIKILLAAYFSGDGGVDIQSRAVVCDSVSEGLIADLEFLLLRLGIFARKYIKTTKGGKVIQEFYITRGKKPKETTYYRLKISSKHAKAFFKKVGFTLKKKQEQLKKAVNISKYTKFNLKEEDNFYYDPVKTITILRNNAKTYSLNVTDNHIVLANGIYSPQCDGDEIAIMLLMDALLNFSRQYLPDKRGGRAMDAPLVITTNLNPLEVDDEVYDFDRSWVYPKEFYEATLDFADPWSIKCVKRVEDFLGKPEQYYDFGFTHPLDNINNGVRVTSYKSLETMMDKLAAQMDLAMKSCAVNESDVASLIINKHFLRDIKGNLRRFTNQSFRCVECNAKYRRVPLIGRCTACNGKLLLTVSQGTVTKYLEPSIKLAENHGVDPYIKQSLEILKHRIEALFGWDTFKQTSLDSFFK